MNQGAGGTLGTWLLFSAVRPGLNVASLLLSISILTVQPLGCKWMVTAYTAPKHKGAQSLDGDSWLYHNLNVT